MEESTFKKSPSSNLLLAVLTSLCCCMPLGIVAVIKASRVKHLYEKGEYNLAIKTPFKHEVLLCRDHSLDDLLVTQPFGDYMDSCSRK